MTFKTYLEAVIVPPQLKITTTDIKKLNKQFKNTIVEFIYTKEGESPHGGYRPGEDSIVIRVEKDMPLNVLETLIQHELIHLEQDKRSGGRMAADIAKDFKILKDIEEYIKSLDEDEEVDPATLKLYQDTVIKMDHLNKEEYQTYAYMYAKLFKDKKINDVIKIMQKDWMTWTNKKVSNRMLKYFASYWIIKEKL